MRNSFKSEVWKSFDFPMSRNEQGERIIEKKQ